MLGSLWDKVFLAFMLFVLEPFVHGICPMKCVCNEANLTTTCSDANLTVVPIFLNPGIRSFDLSGNKIRNLEGALSFYGSLESLDMSRNELRHVGKKQFAQQLSLQMLNLSGNYLTSLKDNSFQGPENLQVLDLNHNVLSELKNDTFKGLHRLVELRLRHNALQTIHPDAFRGLSRLRVLDLERNKITTLSPEWLWPLENLRFLYASQNAIANLPDDAFKGLKALQEIDLRYNVISNDLSAFAFRGSRSIDTVDLSFNRLQSVPNEALVQLQQLSHLDLSGNPLIEVERESLKGLHMLQVLIVSNSSELAKIDGSAFEDTIKLRELYLEHNPNLEPLPWGVFSSSSSLELISFRGNAWTTLSSRQLSRPSLRKLYLEGLPFHCNCSLIWLWELYNRTETISDSYNGLELDDAVCNSVAAPPTPSVDQFGQPRGGQAGDPLTKMTLDQLICSDVSHLLLIISISIIVIVLTLVVTAIIVYKSRHYKVQRLYGGASCLHFKDDNTMIHKSALRTYPMSPPPQPLVRPSSDYSPSEEPVYELPHNHYSDPKSSVSSSSKYSSSSAGGLVGSELWESDYFGGTGHCYTNPTLQRINNQQSQHGSPHSSTSTGVVSMTGSSSNASSNTGTTSNNMSSNLVQISDPAPHRPIFYSPSRFQNKAFNPGNSNSSSSRTLLLHQTPQHQQLQPLQDQPVFAATSASSPRGGRKKRKTTGSAKKKERNVLV